MLPLEMQSKKGIQGSSSGLLKELELTDHDMETLLPTTNIPIW